MIASEGLATDVEEMMGEEEMAAKKAQMRSRKALSDKPQDMQVSNTHFLVTENLELMRKEPLSAYIGDF